MTETNKKQIKSVAIFCGSRLGTRLHPGPAFSEEVNAVATMLAADGFDLVYGGGKSGLMGVIFDAFHDAGRKVTAVITHIFRKVSGTVESPNYVEQVCDHLSTRKQNMIDNADVIVVLPGGFGTLDELFTALAIIDMQMAGKSEDHVKPVIVLNTDDIYHHLPLLIDDIIKRDFIHNGRQRLIRLVATPEEVRDKIRMWNVEGIKSAAELLVQSGIVPPQNSGPA